MNSKIHVKSKEEHKIAVANDWKNLYTKTSEKCDKGEQHNDGTGVLSADTGQL